MAKAVPRAVSDRGVMAAIAVDVRPAVVAAAVENARDASSGEWPEESSRLTPHYAERFYQMD